MDIYFIDSVIPFLGICPKEVLILSAQWCMYIGVYFIIVLETKKKTKEREKEGIIKWE